MTDTPIDFDALLAMDDELEFDGDAEVAAPPPPAARKPRRAAATPAPAPAPAVTEPAATTGEPIDFDALFAMDGEIEFDGDVAAVAPPPPPARKAPSRGKASETSSVAVPEAAMEEPAGAPAPLPPPDAASAGPEPATRRDRIPPLLAVLVALACLTSLIALGSTIAIGRTLAAARADRDRAAEQAETLARLPAIVAALDRASTRLDHAVAAAGGATGSPATTADVNAAIDGLKLALSERQPSGVAPIAGTLRDGFSEIDAHLGRIEDRLGAKGR